MLAFLGFWLVAAVVTAFLFLALGAFMGDFTMVLMVSLPLAACFSLMSRVDRLEHMLLKAEQEKALEETRREKQRQEEERLEQERVEQEMMEAVVAAELGTTRED